MPNAIIVAGMDTFTVNVRLHHNCPSEVEDKIVVDGIPEDVEVDEEGDKEEVVVEDHNSQLEPLCPRRDQNHLDRNCSQFHVQLQCLAPIRQERDRETSCALSWPP